MAEQLLDKFFPDECIVVPMPSSAKRMEGKEQHWGALELCKRAVAKGLAADCEELLERTETVPKSHLQKSKDRVSAENHYKTMRATKGCLGVKRSFTIVDDVITRGATLIGAAARLREAFPQATVRGFAFARTLIRRCVERLPDPLDGHVVIYPSGATFRFQEE
ncbi:MAG: hypothetical protein CSA62_02230 [Planctomycetota bacterium]|nr:MAG: hypothetical protein CSA62_02230 [Planctomycetota bacterium]